MEEIGATDASLGILIGGHQSIGMKGARALRHRGAEEAVAAGARVRRDDRRLRPDRAGGGLRRGFDPDDGRLRRGDGHVRPQRQQALDLERRLREVLHGLRARRRARGGGRAPRHHGVRRDEGPRRRRAGQRGAEARPEGLLDGSDRARRTCACRPRTFSARAGQGFKIAVEILNTGRTSLGAGCIGGSKAHDPRRGRARDAAPPVRDADRRLRDDPRQVRRAWSSTRTPSSRWCT